MEAYGLSLHLASEKAWPFVSKGRERERLYLAGHEGRERECVAASMRAPPLFVYVDLGSKG